MKKEKEKKKKTRKKRISKELFFLMVSSFVLLVLGFILFRTSEHQIALAVILGTIPYGYDLLDFWGKEKFTNFGKFAGVVSFLLRFVFGTFIGVAASVVVIGKHILKTVE